MHEAGVARRLVERAEKLLADEGADRVTGMRIKIGGYSHITRRSLRAQLDAWVTETPIAGAEFEFEAGSKDVTDPASFDVVLVDVTLDGP